MSRLAVIWFTLAVFVAGTPLLASFIDVRPSLQPMQPLPGEDFTLTLEGLAAQPVTVHTVQTTDQSLRIVLQTLDCDASCPPRPFRVVIPVSGGSPHLEEGVVLLSVFGFVGSPVPDPTYLFETYFALGETLFHRLRPEVTLDPFEPTDNDSLEMLVATEPNVCGWSPPQLERIDRQPNSLSVFLKSYSGFGGSYPGYFNTFSGVGHDTSGDLKNDKCSPAINFLHALKVDLGLLETGPYELLVYIAEGNPFSLPIRVNRRTFQVTDAPSTALLQQERFEVQVDWLNHAGESGVGQPVPNATDESTLFTFFGRENWEVMVKVLDGCSFNGHYWVYAAAATDVEYTVTVTDLETGGIWTSTNPLGNPASSVNDIQAFATCSFP